MSLQRVPKPFQSSSLRAETFEVTTYRRVKPLEHVAQ